jgi:DNA mismatch endonuclease (patch repair protein)
MAATTDRSAIMRAVTSQDTKPEMAIRRLIHRLGYRYRLHRADLPGKPDLVFPIRRKVIFVHGCWWHGHDCKRGAREPKTNTAYWRAKIGRNVTRDRTNRAALKSIGWRVCVIWECEIKDLASMETRIRTFLNEV